jgi:molecular chaperone GrpE
MSKNQSNPWKDRKLEGDEAPPMVDEASELSIDPDLEEELEDEIESLEDIEKSEDSGDKRHAALETKLREAHDHLLRSKADIENVRRRAEQDVSRAHKYANEKLVKELLGVIDSLEQALETEGDDTSMREGVELTHKMLLGTLAKFGVEEVNPMNERFDPAFHEAMAMQPAEGVEANTVITVYQKGYILNGRLVRPARVVVSKA